MVTLGLIVPNFQGYRCSREPPKPTTIVHCLNPYKTFFNMHILFTLLWSHILARFPDILLVGVSMHQNIYIMSNWSQSKCSQKWIIVIVFTFAIESHCISIWISISFVFHLLYNIPSLIYFPALVLEAENSL